MEVVQSEVSSSAELREKIIAERQARAANAADLWNKIWLDLGEEKWRAAAMNRTYTRIERMTWPGAFVVDLGGGTGTLCKRLQLTRKAETLLIDHSEEAIRKASEDGVQRAMALDLETRLDLLEDVLKATMESAVTRVVQVVSTECIEHLSEESRNRLFEIVSKNSHYAMFSVPNDRLGPEEEAQHTVKYNAMSFKRDLLKHFKSVRVEVLGPYLLAICNLPRGFTLSVTLPVRDEGRDLEATLASFRGVADEIVVGVDPRTTDNTWEIAEKYADVVFFVDSPEGPQGDNERKIHFAHVRNQCMEKCSSEWIFMTEGHERLVHGFDELNALDTLDKRIQVVLVQRSGNNQVWMFPWLCRNRDDIRYVRHTHNTLDFPSGTYCVWVPSIRTLHERHSDREQARAAQRKGQNRAALLDDWMRNYNDVSLHYLGAEYREHSSEKAIERLEEFLALPARNGAMRYHSRLLLAKLYAQKGDSKQCRNVLIQAVGDDWQRIDHWVWLGDLAYIQGNLEEALQFYAYTATKIGTTPTAVWWVDLGYYSWIPSQRLCMVYAELGLLEEALQWARRVIEFLPDDFPVEGFEEAQENLRLIEEKIEDGKRRIEYAS